MKPDKMLRTGQMPMDVNGIPGLMLDESEDKMQDNEGRINALQDGDLFFFCKKPGHKKRDCRKFDEWKKKNSNRKTGSNPRNSNFQNTVSCYNCGKEGHICRECRGERRNN